MHSIFGIGFIPGVGTSRYGGCQNIDRKNFLVFFLNFFNFFLKKVSDFRIFFVYI